MRANTSRCLATFVQAAAAALLAAPAGAGNLTVQVLDREGAPLPNVAVYLQPSDPAVGTGAQHSARAVESVEQINNMFVPHMLVVQTGTEVSFPNNDTVSHHVYSFSEARSFQLDLYRGNVHPPQLFDKPGLVVLGCNIHDSMLGYILVVDTPWSAITAPSGTAALAALPAGEYDLLVWTPRARSSDLPAARKVTVNAGGSLSLTVQLSAKLNPPHSSAAGSLNWKDY